MASGLGKPEGFHLSNGAVPASWLRSPARFYSSRNAFRFGNRKPIASKWWMLRNDFAMEEILTPPDGGSVVDSAMLEKPGVLCIQDCADGKGRDVLKRDVKSPLEIVGRFHMDDLTVDVGSRPDRVRLLMIVIDRRRNRVRRSTPG